MEQVFNDRGFHDFDVSKIKGYHPKREYCVQYRESDHDFIARLAEEEGIFWFFKHENGRHTLVLRSPDTTVPAVYNQGVVAIGL